jgi:hypothetical protein
MALKQTSRPKRPRQPIATGRKPGKIPTVIRVKDFPLLADLCWSGAVEELPARHALTVYERNWRFVDRKKLKPRERQLLNGLIRQFGAGVVNA